MGARARLRRYVDQRDRAACAAGLAGGEPFLERRKTVCAAQLAGSRTWSETTVVHSGSTPQLSDRGGASLPLHMVLKDTASVVEDVVDDSIEVLACGIWTGANTDHEIRAGNCHLDANAMGLSVFVSMVRRLDSYAEVRDAVEKCLELRGSPIDVVCNGRRCLDAAERDLNGGLHVRLLVGTLSRSRAEAAS